MRKIRRFARFVVSQSTSQRLLAIGWDLTADYLFPMVELNGERGITTITAPRMTAALQAHLRAGEMPDHFTMHCFRVGRSLRKSLAGTAVDEIMEIGGWKTERVARYYIGATTIASVEAAKGRRDGGSRRERDDSYAIAMDFPLSPAFQEDFAACRPREGIHLSMGEMMCDPAQQCQRRVRVTTQGSMGRTTGWGRRPHLIQYLH